LEYACPAWHTSLTQQQTTSLENIQCLAGIVKKYKKINKEETKAKYIAHHASFQQSGG